MHKYSLCYCCLSRWASRATSRSLSRAALMAAVADAVRRGAQRAPRNLYNFSRKMCSFGLIQIFRPRSRPNSDIPCSFGIYIIRSTCTMYGRRLGRRRYCYIHAVLRNCAATRTGKEDALGACAVGRSRRPLTNIHSSDLTFYSLAACVGSRE